MQTNSASVDRSMVGPILSLPGDRPDLVPKALSSGARTLILDLEDAVAPSRKEAAREDVAAALAQRGSDLDGVIVRVNAPGSPWFDEDCQVIAGAPGSQRLIMIPKVESETAMTSVARHRKHGDGDRLLGVVALVESARGMLNLERIAASAGVVALAIGYIDLAADLGRSHPSGHPHWGSIRNQLLLVARAYGLRALDGPSAELSVTAEFVAEVEGAVDWGFDAKWVLHPRQVAVVAKAFTPSAEELARARALLSGLSDAHAADRGAISVDGQMVDEAVAALARRTIDRAEELPI